jgi:hypothetical protein
VAFTLEQVVPWGRSFDEYRRMFALADEDMGLRILGCADGPASFNAVATRQGATVYSCDPIYRFTAYLIRTRIAATYDKIIEQTKEHEPVCLGQHPVDRPARTYPYVRDE